MNEQVKLVLVLTVIALISGGVLAETYKFANPLIEENRRMETEEAILQVLPGSSRFEEAYINGKEAYKGYDDHGQLVGLALPLEGDGFQGVIRMMVGVDIESDKILGMKILEHLETPGLGARIGEDDFQEQFRGKSINDKFIPGDDVDGITGATVSSRAVVDGLKKGFSTLREANVDRGGGR